MLIKQRVLEWQWDPSKAPNILALILQCWLYTSHFWSLLPFAEPDGMFSPLWCWKVDIENSPCLYVTGAVETTEHVLLSYRFYQGIFQPLLRKQSGHSDLELIRKFLMGVNPQITIYFPRFFLAACKIDKDILFTDSKFI